MRKIILIGGMLIVALTSGVVQADPCDKDRSTVCNDVTAGDGRVHDCLIGRRDQLTPACASAIDRADQLALGVVDACKPEVQRWCAQYTGDGRAAVIHCLKSKKDVIGDACKSKYRQFKALGFDIRS